MVLHRAATFAAVASVAACSAAQPPAPAAPVAAACTVGAAPRSANDTLVLATTAPIDRAHAPEPTNAAEQLVFAQAYETLIDVDCDGRAQPALAASFALDASGTRVLILLRDDARFSNGAPVTARDVLASWQATAERPTRGGRLARTVAAGTTVTGSHGMMVSLPDAGWQVLASSALAVYQPATASSAVDWPAGTGRYRIVDDQARAPSSAVLLEPSTPSSNSHLLTRRIASGDARDAVDAGADVIITADPVAVAYASTRGNLAAIPLPWTRTYALAAPTTSSHIIATLVRDDAESTTLRESLARDAVRVEARAVKRPYWRDVATACAANVDAQHAAPAPSRQSNRIVYRRDDNIARGVAERIVALEPQAVAAALGPADFASALRAGGDLAYVLDLLRASLSPCNDLGELLLDVPWLSSGNPEAKLVPLIDTRGTAIIDRKRVSGTMDWCGTLRFGSSRKAP